MRRKRKSLTPDAPLAPVPVRDSRSVRSAKARSRHEELDAAVRRFKKAIIERALGRRADPPPGLSAGRRRSPRTRPIIATGRAARRC